MPVSNRIVPGYKQGWAVNQVSEFPGLWKGVDGSWSPFLGPTGGKLLDHSNKENHGTLTNGPTWIIGPDRYALNFNRADSEYVDTNESALFNYGQLAFAVSFVARRNSIGTIHNFLGKFNNAGVDGWYIQFRSSNELIFDIIEQLGVDRIFWQSDDQFTDTDWHSYSFVRNGTNSIFVVKDGVPLAGSLTVDDGAPSVTSASTLKIGEDGGGGNYFDGDIADVVLHGRGLPVGEAIQLHEERLWGRYVPSFGPNVFGDLAVANVGALFNAGLMERERLFQ